MQKAKSYLVIVDYFSRYIEVQPLSSTTSASLISSRKSIFSRHGIPDTLMSDNSPQFVSKEMSQFAKAYGFIQVTSSPHYPQSNGLVERA
uniref:Integrase catalytic domain-containing protein n=1 Tax=Amphimedon queenslandica TaxID=400682 RepID=A0A1X7U3E4_AMPQE